LQMKDLKEVMVNCSFCHEIISIIILFQTWF
jgi:hypothetical protein